jgi:predicted nucleic acid-binding Zn ribbon protein
MRLADQEEMWYRAAMGERRTGSWSGAGQWEAHRERCRIADRRPPPAFREAVPVGDVLPAVLERLGIGRQEWLGALRKEWQTLVGDAVSRHTRPGRLEGRTLTVFVDSSVWLSELSRYGRSPMLANLQRRFGAEKIATVLVRLDPEGPAPSGVRRGTGGPTAGGDGRLPPAYPP